MIKFALDKSKLDISIYNKELQDSNIESISRIFEVLKFDKFKEVIVVQYANIKYIYSTLDVSKLVTSIEVKEMQL